MKNPDECPKCLGCGQLADTDDQEPWSMWLDLPLKSSAAVLLGLVKPMPCPKCGGSGQRIDPALVARLLDDSWPALLEQFGEDRLDREVLARVLVVGITAARKREPGELLADVAWTASERGVE